MLAQSNFKEDLFCVGQKKFFAELLRPFVSVNSYFCCFRLLKILNFLCACSDLYAHPEHTGQEQMHTLTIRIISLRFDFKHLRTVLLLYLLVILHIRLIIHIRRYGPVVQHWIVMQEIVV
jgi:hypothetical protein